MCNDAHTSASCGAVVDCGVEPLFLTLPCVCVWRWNNNKVQQMHQPDDGQVCVTEALREQGIAQVVQSSLMCSADINKKINPLEAELFCCISVSYLNK